MANEPIKYKKKWRVRSLNKPFWNEVLVGRTITKLFFNKEGLTAMKLDSGEISFLRDKGTLYIKCDQL